MLTQHNAVPAPTWSGVQAGGGGGGGKRGCACRRLRRRRLPTPIWRRLLQRPATRGVHFWLSSKLHIWFLCDKWAYDLVVDGTVWFRLLCFASFSLSLSLFLFLFLVRECGSRDVRVTRANGRDINKKIGLLEICTLKWFYNLLSTLI